ncbi:MAG: hypothetical protein V7745_00020 [Pseudomonadales bacterium]
MPRREDDDIDVVAGLSASRDEQRPPAQPQAAVKTKAAASSQPASAKTKTSSHSTNPVVQKSGGGFKWFVVLVLLVVIGAGGWLGLQVLELKERLSDNKNALQLERSRMESISAQVHETGSSFAETGNVLETKFSFFESEIRKLWDVANKRNKKDIASNASKVKSLDAKLKKSQQGFEGKLKALTSGQFKTTQAVAKLNKRLVSENTALRASLEEQNEELLLISGEFEVLQQRLKNLPNNLSQRVAVNEEAVEAIDASRQQLQARLRKLQKQVELLLPAAP